MCLVQQAAGWTLLCCHDSQVHMTNRELRLFYRVAAATAAVSVLICMLFKCRSGLTPQCGSSRLTAAAGIL